MCNPRALPGAYLSRFLGPPRGLGVWEGPGTCISSGSPDDTVVRWGFVALC